MKTKIFKFAVVLIIFHSHKGLCFTLGLFFYLLFFALFFHFFFYLYLGKRRILVFWDGKFDDDILEVLIAITTSTTFNLTLSSLMDAETLNK